MRCVALVILVAACGNAGSAPDASLGDDASIDAAAAPLLHAPVALPDEPLARDAIAILDAKCAGCHSLTREQLQYWRLLSDTARSECLTDLAVESAESARRMIDCARTIPTSGSSDFAAQKLGIYSVAAPLDWFRYTFARAGEPIEPLLAQAAMPRAQPPVSQPELDVLAEWFERGLPKLDVALPDEQPPTSCTDAIGPEVAAHVDAMATQGWRATNASNLMAMHDLGGTPTAASQSYGAGWDVPGRGVLRVLADVEYATAFWTRSSADGRFIAHGVRDVPGSYVLDLQRGVRVPIAADYDPAWFPDGSGFVFHGGVQNICAQSVLTSNPAEVTMTEPACADLASIGLYETLGRALGGDYFAVDSRFVTDDGGHTATLTDPRASFTSNATLGFVPMIFDGSSYVARPRVTVPTPFEGDVVVSPSARLAITRIAGTSDVQLGFALREIRATPMGSTYTITTPEVARYCLRGGKPGFSYDERWITYHHYVTANDAVELGFTGPNDPAFQPYLSQGAANLYVLELATGQRFRITHMRPGQYALFPHFRSDGWIYAAVRDRNTRREYMIASDAARLAE